MTVVNIDIVVFWVGMPIVLGKGFCLPFLVGTGSLDPLGPL